MTRRRKIGIWSVGLLVVLIGAVPLVGAQPQSLKQVIVKCSAEDLDQIRAQVGAAIITGGHGHFVLAVPSTTTTDRIESVRGKGPILASENRPLSIRRTPLVSAGYSTGRVPYSSLGPIVDWYGTPARLGYTNQAATGKIRLKDALGAAATAGAGVRVAVIDTGIDQNHPTLKSVTLPGKNYIGRTPVPSEWDDPMVPPALFDSTDESDFNSADRPQLSFTDSSQMSYVDQSQTVFVDQSKLGFVNTIKQLPAFGHGTMMAGLVHLVAPKAGIIPLKAFDATGAGTDWNVVQAIYDAIDLGADVINMSFSSTQRSRILDSAIQFAARSGAVVVSAGGNDNSEQRTYPASLPETISVSALDYNDQKAAFSNYGSWIDLSAIGVDLVTTYPGGHWAMGSGTSDAVPLVSGVLALVKRRGVNGSSARQTVEDNADPLRVPYQYWDKLGKGRLDAFKAVTND